MQVIFLSETISPTAPIKPFLANLIISDLIAFIDCKGWPVHWRNSTEIWREWTKYPEEKCLETFRKKMNFLIYLFGSFYLFDLFVVFVCFLFFCSFSPWAFKTIHSGVLLTSEHAQKRVLIYFIAQNAGRYKLCFIHGCGLQQQIFYIDNIWTLLHMIYVSFSMMIQAIRTHKVSSK